MSSDKVKIGFFHRMLYESGKQWAAKGKALESVTDKIDTNRRMIVNGFLGREIGFVAPEPWLSWSARRKEEDEIRTVLKKQELDRRAAFDAEKSAAVDEAMRAGGRKELMALLEHIEPDGSKWVGPETIERRIRELDNETLAAAGITDKHPMANFYGLEKKEP